MKRKPLKTAKQLSYRQSQDTPSPPPLPLQGGEDKGEGAKSHRTLEIQSSIIKLVVALTIISSVAAATLAMVFDITKEPIAAQQRLKMVRSLKAVLPQFDNEIDKDLNEISLGQDSRGDDRKITFYNARSGGSLIGVAFKVIAPDGYKGDIEIMMGVSPEKRITGIEILGHKETPGLGDKIKEKWWRDEFKGKSLDGPKLAVKKDGGDIDQFTGATISPRAVANAVKKGLELFEKGYKNGGNG